MKKNTYITVIICAILCSFLLSFGAMVGQLGADTIYTAEAVVEQIDDTGVITLVDSMGEAWEYEGADCEVGQTVTVVFNRMDTDSIYDDEIIEIKVG